MISKKYQLSHWMQPDERVWIEQSKGSEPYKKGVIDKVSDIKIVCKQQDNTLIDVKPSQIEQRSTSTVLHTDLMDVEILNNAELLEQLKGNFKQHKIYTFVGPTLVITNPYEFYKELYTIELRHFYIQKIINEQVNYKDLQPHIYGIVSEVIRVLQKSKVTQSILVSGESGAGKTEANKECMVLIAQFYNQGEQNLHSKVLSCNPLLEAFGNAKTIRNDNSSRFGRFIEISVGGKEVKRATITSYLLEKSRVTSQLQGQRNFHIFYAFLLGCNSEQKLKYSIPERPFEQFEYLRNSQPMSFDKETYQQVKKSLIDLGFKQSQQTIWKIISAILHLGNLKFIPSNKPDNFCEIVNKNILELISKLLGVSPESFLKALTSYELRVGNDCVVKPTSLSEIKQIRDSLSRQLYEKLFLWLISCLNQNLGKTAKGQQPVIGLLDIYGFEVLKQNSFEQLCINFTNQRLHQLYIEQVFKGEKILFNSEGLGEHLVNIQFKDNQELIDLLDTSLLSVFNLLDQWCSVASTDQAFTTNMRYNHKMSPYFPPNNLNAPKDIFIIRHTPRDVQYTITTFRQKNKNLLRDDVVSVLRKSTLPILAEMFKQDPMQDRPLNSNTNRIRRFLGSRFRNQMNELVSSLRDKSQMYFIRCIKSNNTKSPGTFDNRVALEQIRYLGILDTIKMRKNSYSVRMKYRQFLDKYPWYRYFLLGKNNTNDDKQTTFKLIQKFCSQFSQDEVLFGQKKIFLRSYADYELNSKYKKHIQKLNTSAKVIISALRKNLYQARLKQKIQNRAVINTYIQGFLKSTQINKKIVSAIKIQRVFRQFYQQKSLRQKRISCIIIQKYWKRIIQNQKRKKIVQAVKVIEHHYKRHILRKRFMQYLIVRPIAEGYLIDMTWNLIKFLNREIIQKYLTSVLAQLRNKYKIKQLQRNLKRFQSVKKSESVQRYFLAIPHILFFKKVTQAAIKIQRRWKTMKLRKLFVSIKKSTCVIQKYWKEYFHKRIHSQRIFNKFFQSYIKDLGSYNQYCRNILLGVKKSKQDDQFYIEECLKNYLSNFKSKMTIIYYTFDFEAYITMEDIYPEDSWIQNYCRLYKQGLNKNTPVQQIKVSEQTTVTATSNRLYQWGGFKEDSDKIHMIQTNQQIYTYNLVDEKLLLSTKQPQLIKDHIKEVSTYKKKYLMQQLNIYEKLEDTFTQVKIMNISKFGNREEKVVELSCGDGHIVCRTISKKVYSWGTNKQGQLGHQNYNYTSKPKSISLIQKIAIAEPVQIATSSNCTIVLMSNRRLLWCGKNGTINNVNVPTQIDFENRLIGNSQLFAPLRIQVSSSRTMSVIGATYLSFNGVLDNNIPLRNKLIGIMTNKFHEYGMDLINLPFDKNIANYVTQSTIRMPIYKPNIEMQSRKQLKNLEEEVKHVLGEDPLDISFSKNFVMEHQVFK